MTEDGGGSQKPGAADLVSGAKASGKLFQSVRLLISGGLVSPFPGAARAEDAVRQDLPAKARLTRRC